MEVPQAQFRRCRPVLPGGEGEDGVIRGLVEHLDLNLCAGDGTARLEDLKGTGVGPGVSGGLIVPADRPLLLQQRPVQGGAPPAKGPGVDQQGPSGGGVEPPPVQHGLRLAGP